MVHNYNTSSMCPENNSMAPLSLTIVSHAVICSKCVLNSYTDLHQQLYMHLSICLYPSATVQQHKVQFPVLMFLDLVVEGGPGRGRMRGSKSNMNGNIEESVSFVDFLCLQCRNLALCFSDASHSYCSWVLLPLPFGFHMKQPMYKFR